MYMCTFIVEQAFLDHLNLGLLFHYLKKPLCQLTSN